MVQTKIFSCHRLANTIHKHSLQKGESFKKQYRRSPSLAVILVGEDPASKIYVRKKKEACDLCGIKSKDIHLDETIEEKELLEQINILNEDESIDGILIQSPLPRHIKEDIVSTFVDTKKDVDCFHPKNVGNFYLDTKRAMKEGMPPCTPAGVMAVLEENTIAITGKHAVVIGRSNIVGKPMAQMLLSKDATVTLCHSKTSDLKSICQKAKILVSAIGKGNLIKEDYIQPGAILIDVGISRSRTKEGKSTLQGDMDKDSVLSKASFLTPVPGGIGLMTIAMLMKNTIRAAFLRKE